MGITTTKMSAALTSTVKAMIMAPKTIKGERRNRRNTRLTPDCTWLMSLVILVISVEVPSLSIWEKERLWIWEKSPCLNFVAKPTAALAAKYWAVTAQIRPISPSAAMIRHILMMYPLSLPEIPTSIMDATTSGTISSKEASNNLKRGPSTLSFL